MERAPTTAPTAENLRKERNVEFPGVGEGAMKGSEAAEKVVDDEDGDAAEEEKRATGVEVRGRLIRFSREEDRLTLRSSVAIVASQRVAGAKESVFGEGDKGGRVFAGVFVL